MLTTSGVALGITSICLLWLVGGLVVSTGETVYHWDSPASQLFLPPLLDFCAFWLLVALVLFLVRGRVRIALLCGIIALTPWVELKNWGYMSHKSSPHWLSVLVLALGLSIFPILLVWWRSQFEEKFAAVEKFATTVFIFAGLHGILILSQYAWLGWQARSLNAEVPLHAATHETAAQAGRPRVIWILFDELSYEQVYEHRFPGLQLPAFDALAAAATVFTHATPAGIETEIVLPSLLTGAPVDEIRSSSDGRALSLRNPHTGAWQKFNEHDTVFQDALNLNYSTAVAGWYNPYCRILPDVLDHCFWKFGYSASNEMMPRASLEPNLMNPWWMRFSKNALVAHLASSYLHIAGDRNAERLNAEQHLSDYVALAAAADRIVEDRSAGFSLIHLPIPHPNGIYDRKTDRFALTNSDYLDNLALSDKFLKHLRSELEASGQWDSSTIVIMGDHSWRTKFIWEHEPGLTKEEQAASRGGQFDDRPAYIVKLPQQHSGATIDAPFDALNTRRLLDALLEQKIQSKEELSEWVKQVGK
ncbi:MAG: sulfatase-like hydrolase/transferase [Edaphobacter sp.]